MLEQQGSLPTSENVFTMFANIGCQYIELVSRSQTLAGVWLHCQNGEDKSDKINTMAWNNRGKVAMWHTCTWHHNKAPWVVSNSNRNRGHTSLVPRLLCGPGNEARATHSDALTWLKVGAGWLNFDPADYLERRSRTCTCRDTHIILFYFLFLQSLVM